MKVILENKKGLSKNFKVIIDKKTMSNHFNEKYDELKKNVVLKGFRPGKVPIDILKRQFGQAVVGEVIDKVLKETSAKVLKDNKIRPASQPKIDLKNFGENKDLEYVISITELPIIDLKNITNIKFNDYAVKIDKKETDKRIQEIAKSQKNFKETSDEYKSNLGDLVIFDYKATVSGESFKGSESKNTQLVLGKDLFIKGFDKQLIGIKKNDVKKVEVNLPENFPEKNLSGKLGIFECKITQVKKPDQVTIDDNFAKNLGAKDLVNLKELISKQINDEYKNSLDLLSKQEIIDQLSKIKIDEIPKDLIDQEIKIITQGMKEDEIKKDKKNLEIQANKRIKTGLILNAFGEKNNIKVNDQDIQNEIQKQLSMMPGQEKILTEYYQKNPSAIASLRGSIYEEKIISEIKKQCKSQKKELTKTEAEKLLKSANENKIKETEKNLNVDSKKINKDEKKSTKPMVDTKKQAVNKKKTKKLKKVSKN